MPYTDRDLELIRHYRFQSSSGIIKLPQTEKRSRSAAGNSLRPDTMKRSFMMQPHSIPEPSFPQNLDDYAPWVAIHGLTAPYGECQCGCGQKTSTARQLWIERGYSKGHPVRYVNNHGRKKKPDDKQAPWVAMFGLTEPYGKCQCGCNGDAPISTATHPKKGTVLGKPSRFLHGHGTAFCYRANNPNPSGLCMCGCGQPAPIAESTSTRVGNVKGFPVRFIVGHRWNGARESASECFWFYCINNGPDSCWDWTGPRHPFGYGYFGFGGQTISAHRFSYELQHGPIPKGDGYHGNCVLHSCDNPTCCNPEHLFLGTGTDNVDDMVMKRRHAFGEKNGNAKLTEADVREIRRLRSAGVRIVEIARRFKISADHAGNIIRRKSWNLEAEE